MGTESDRLAGQLAWKAALIDFVRALARANVARDFAALRSQTEMVAKTSPLQRYPRKAEIVRAVEAAKACGLDVAGIEVSPTGDIRIFEARAEAPQTAFDRYQHLL